MAPARSKKAKASADSNVSARSQTADLKSPAVTPPHSRPKRTMSITEGQKQALIDNLQLEVTERARKLRAQYALQAQSLRTRIELRINRIPTALRKTNMGEFFSKYEEMQREGPKATRTEERKAEVHADPVHGEQPVAKGKTTEGMVILKSKGTKRNSDAMESVNQGNITVHEDLVANPKKRTRVVANANSRRPPNPSTILSPKSANSRTLPQSPARPTLGSPPKPFNSRLASPLKPKISRTKAAQPTVPSTATEKGKPGRPKSGASRTAASRAAATRSKCGAENAADVGGLRTVSGTSNSSALSTGTTIVKNHKTAPGAAAKKGLGAKATGKKVTAAVAEAPPAGRRVLRKR